MKQCRVAALAQSKHNAVFNPTRNATAKTRRVDPCLLCNIGLRSGAIREIKSLNLFRRVAVRGYQVVKLDR